MKTSIRYGTLFIILFGIVNSHASGQCSVAGTIIDSETKAPIPFATVAIYQNGTLITGAGSKYPNGQFLIENLEPGEYDIESTFLAYSSTQVEGVKIVQGQVTTLNIELKQSKVDIFNVVTTNWGFIYPPLIEFDETSTGDIIIPDLELRSNNTTPIILFKNLRERKKKKKVKSK